uniref:CSON007358 protein n=1 Tax=Culicoides sonorensis TaxID=179676 RepID=A0A336JYF8_CULSO
MHKRTTSVVNKGKTNVNVTIVKFKATETLKRNQVTASLEEKDPLAITDQDLAVASSYLDNKKTNVRNLKTVGARKELPVLNKKSLLTPTGVKKIESIPIKYVVEKKTNLNTSKNKSSSKTLTNTTPKTTTSASCKRPIATRFYSYIDSSDDSDEPLRKKTKGNASSTKKNQKFTRINSKRSKTTNVKLTSKHSKVSNKPKVNNYKTKKSNIKKMIHKSTKRSSNYRMDSAYASKKRTQNLKSNIKKNYVSHNKKTNLLSRKKNKDIEDYLPLIKKYQHLISQNQPYVKLERLKFCAHHFTKERMRLSSDIDLFRDSAVLYGLLGKIFNYLDLTGKLFASKVCHLWNRAINEDAAWQKLPLKNLCINDLKPIERLILKRETNEIILHNVDLCGKAEDYEFSRLSSVKTIIIEKNSSPLLINKFLIACNELEDVKTTETNFDNLRSLNNYVKSLNAENTIVGDTENRLLKTWADLEKVIVHSFDPNFYHNMGLLLSLKYLKLKQLWITANIAQFIENIPNIEYLEFSSDHLTDRNIDGNRAIVESLKHCPSLKKLIWIIVKEIEIKEEKFEIKVQKLEEKKEIPIDEETHTNLEVSKAINQQICEFQSLSDDMETEQNQTNDEIIQKDEFNKCDTKTTITVSYLPKEDHSNVNLYESLKSIQESGASEVETKKPKDDDDKEMIEQSYKIENIVDSSFSSVLPKNNEISDLQLMALEVFLKTSLPECQVIFKND